MAILFLLFCGLFCLVKDCFINLVVSVNNRQHKKIERNDRVFEEKTDNSISMNELLTFEELMEDDKN